MPITSGSWPVKTVLITGGTKGIGLACGLAFAKLGAVCVLTNKWGSANESEIYAEFARTGAPRPLIVEADVAVPEQTLTLMDNLHSRFDEIDVFICNVALAQNVAGLTDYQRRGFLKSIEYSAWPLIDYTLAIGDKFGKYPRYVIGVSSLGPDHFLPNYDFAAASKACLETLAKYLHARLCGDDVRVNILRTGMVLTDSLLASFGSASIKNMQESIPDLFLPAEDIAKAAVGLCSGWMDAVGGQIITVDKGSSFNLASAVVNRSQNNKERT